MSHKLLVPAVIVLLGWLGDANSQTISFVNGTASRVAVKVKIDTGYTGGFTLESGKTDSSVTVRSGDTLRFWWREDAGDALPGIDDTCVDPNPPCSMNSVAIASSSVTVTLGDPSYNKQTK